MDKTESTVASHVTALCLLASVSSQPSRLFSTTYCVRHTIFRTLNTQETPWHIMLSIAHYAKAATVLTKLANIILYLVYFLDWHKFPSVQADGDLVSAVDFSTQYLVTGHEVIHPSFFRFCMSRYVSARAKPPSNIPE